MRKFGIYTMYDETADEYSPVFEAKNNGIAMRYFQNALSAQHVNVLQDFHCYKIAEVDKDTCEVIPLEKQEVFAPAEQESEPTAEVKEIK